jgi:hypothetical protein
VNETATGVKWEAMSEDGIVYHGDGFTVRARVNSANWWVYTADGTRICDNYAPDFATAKRDAERWIMEREGRLPAPVPATDGGGWIACSERMPEVGKPVEVITNGSIGTRGWTWDGRPTHWRLRRPVDPHAVAACLFDDRYRPTVEQARAAARHVAGCAECRAKLEEKGGA